MSQPHFLGLDLGGTFIKGLLLSSDGEVVRSGSAPTARRGADAVMSGMIDLGRSLVGKQELGGIGVTMPGVVDMARGDVKFLPNVAGAWEGRPAARELQDALGAPGWLINDARAATFGELHFGAGKGLRDFVMVAVGTGIGGGIVARGELVMGRDGLAGEVGHTALELEGPRCSCGGWGCAEALVSGKALTADGVALLASGTSPGLAELVEGDPERVSPRLIAQAAAGGDGAARKLMERAGYRLGMLVSNLALLFNPERVIVGGGIALAGEVLFDGIERTLNDRVGWFLRHTGIEVVPAELGDEAGALGAAAWARKNCEV